MRYRGTGTRYCTVVSQRIPQASKCSPHTLTHAEQLACKPMYVMYANGQHIGLEITIRSAAKGAFTLPPRSAVRKPPLALVPPLLHTLRWATIPTRGAGRTAARGGARSR